MDKVLLVTGGGRGIGAATARQAAQAGWAVAVNYAANALAADEVVRAIRAAGGRALAVQGDVADEAQVLRMFETVDAKLGRLTGLVNANLGWAFGQSTTNGLNHNACVFGTEGFGTICTFFNQKKIFFFH